MSTQKIVLFFFVHSDDPNSTLKPTVSSAETEPTPHPSCKGRSSQSVVILSPTHPPWCFRALCRVTEACPFLMLQLDGLYFQLAVNEGDIRMNIILVALL